MRSILFVIGLIQFTTALEYTDIVTVEQGQVQGKLMQNIKGGEFRAFQGIPYAKPPIGSLRFKDPEPAAPWTGIFNATSDAQRCLQRSMLSDKIFGSEDCLVLHVYAPKSDQNSIKAKPVMVMIHGGGFSVGSGNTDLYGPQFLMTEDIVLVHLNYRLNVFGFLSFDDPKVGVPGNAALKDMVLGLRWVQKNIANFNGDPNSVTIFGCSAGSAAVNLLVLSPSSKGLFHRAIAQSGSPFAPWVFSERKYKRFAEVLSPQSPPTEQMEIFELINATNSIDLLVAQEKLFPIDDRYVGEFSPVGLVVEYSDSNPNAFLTESPEEILAKGTFAHVPYIIGFMKDEGAIYLRGTTEPRINFTDTERVVPRSFGLQRKTAISKAVGEKITRFYFRDIQPRETAYQNYFNMMTDISFSVSIMNFTKALLAKTTQPVYFYEFAYKTELNYMSQVLIDMPFPVACHGDDNGYLYPVKFLEYDYEADSDETKAYERVVKLWTNFAKYGNPNGPKRTVEVPIEWQPMSLQKLEYLRIDKELSMRANPIPERLTFWDNLRADVLQGNIV